jgi:EpsI family protein
MTTTMRTRVIIIVVALGLASAAVARADRHEEPPVRMSFSLFPMQFGEWQGVQRPPFTARVLEVLGLDDYITRYYYRDPKSPVDLYIGYWKSQQQGGAIHSPQNCLPGAGWEPLSQRLLTFPDPRNPAAPPLSVNRYVIGKGLDRQLVLYWYQSRGRVVGSEYWSKIYLVLDAARYNRTDAALVRLLAPINGTSPEAEVEAERQVLDFAKVVLPALGAYLPN